MILNEVRKGVYLDSVALMRLSRKIAGRDGVEEAALMMGTPANLEILAEAGVLDPMTQAGGGDLVIALRGEDAAVTEALALAKAELDAPRSTGGAATEYRPKSLRSATDALPEATLALISVPGAFAVAEARKAIGQGLHAMIFSDNVPLEDEAALKREAQTLGRLVMGPDCGTALIGGVPLAFANVVRRGGVGIVGASGTGTQEVSCLIDQLGGGISHAIGVGGRDLTAEVGGISTLMAIDALAADAGTETIVVIAKPPAKEVADAVIQRLARTGKPGLICFLGAQALEMPPGLRQVFTLRDAAYAALGQAVPMADSALAPRPGAALGLYSGGTLAAEAQVVFLWSELAVGSNAPIPGATEAAHQMLDLGADEYTQGRPHPMIDPGVRDAALIDALGRDDLAVILLDVVLGYGAHEDPAGHLADVISEHGRADGPHMIASVTGTDADPQGRANQIATLQAAGVHVARSNSEAAQLAARLIS